MGNLAGLLGAADKIFELMSYQPWVNFRGGDKIESEEVKGTLEVRDIEFSYPLKPNVEVLKGISFSVDTDRNRVVAICGHSGCGKSTVISLIQRFYDPDAGSILFNGEDLRDLDPKWYHSQIGIVQQEPVLFSGTIIDNILYGFDISDLNDEEVERRVDEACRQADAYDFIHDLDRFPLGY